ncbi:MAG: HEPN domain-containing protein [FCB group bacterium]
MVKNLKEIVQKWLIKAGNDFKTAEQGFKAEEIITDTICFHCQQAVEKYLKAYLVSKNISPEKIHKIELLLEQCIKIDPSFEELNGIEILTEYAVELRYPDDFIIPSLEEAEEAFKLARKVRLYIINIFNRKENIIL